MEYQNIAETVTFDEKGITLHGKGLKLKKWGKRAMLPDKTTITVDKRKKGTVGRVFTCCEFVEIKSAFVFQSYLIVILLLSICLPLKFLTVSGPYTW